MAQNEVRGHGDMGQLIEQVITGELIPLAALGILSGFAAGTAFYFLSYGIFKAFSLVNIK